MLACQPQSLVLVATSLAANSSLGKPDPFLTVSHAAILKVRREFNANTWKSIDVSRLFVVKVLISRLGAPWGTRGSLA